MAILLVTTIGVLTIISSRNLFLKWFNHLAIYAFSWMIMLDLFELKLLNYYSLIPRAWFIIVVAFFTFLLGVITIFVARRLFNQDNDSDKNEFNFPFLRNNARPLFYALIITSTIGLFAAIQNWLVLIKMFGSIPMIFIKANWVYNLRVHGEIPGIIPYIASFSFAGMVLSGIYTAYRNKITLVALLPFAGVILKSLAMFGRASLVMALVQFLASYLIFRNALNKNIEISHKINFSNKRSIITIFIVIIFIVGSAALIKSVRKTFENFKSGSNALRSTKKDLLISPSIYLYISANVGVLSEYLYEGKEVATFGENTFAPVYNFLSKFKITKPVSIYLRGYFIPMWTNTGTYLREIYADFGDWGVFLVPYLIGLITTLLWFKFYNQGSIYSFILLIYFYLIISEGFFTMVTRDSNWIISLIVLLVTFSLLNKRPLIVTE